MSQYEPQIEEKGYGSWASCEDDLCQFRVKGRAEDIMDASFEHTEETGHTVIGEDFHPWRVIAK